MKHVLIGIVLLTGAAPAAMALEPGSHPELVRLIDEMVEQHGFSREQLFELFRNVEIRDDILEIMDRPGEAKPWHLYKNNFINPERISGGKRFLKQHRQALRRAQQKYGVPIEIITAIIGVETNYGRLRGRHRVIDALTTLTLKYPRRKRFFRKELKNYLLLTREQGIDPQSLKGSYTGAIGMPQFMPSSYRAYAVDMDGDGSANLANSPNDAIGSVANYFHIHGWRPNKPILSQARFEGNMYPWVADLGYRPMFTTAELVNYGIHIAKPHDRPGKVALLSFEEKDHTRYQVVYHNFYVITRYNNNSKYALAVTELSKRIRRPRKEGDS